MRSNCEVETQGASAAGRPKVGSTRSTMFAQFFLKPKGISFIDTTCHANVARAPPRRGTTAPPLLPEEGFFTPCFPKPNGYLGKSLCKFCLPKVRNLFCLPPGGRVDFRKKIREGERVHKQACSPQCTHFSIVGTWRQTHSVYCPKINEVNGNKMARIKKAIPILL